MVPIKPVNHSPSRRVGPLETLDRGQYKGQRVEDIIRRFPQYIMYCVKEWLDISPWQALLFEEVTGGGIIPDAYIKEPVEKTIPPLGQDILPNWDFHPDLSPSWWPEFKRRTQGEKDLGKVISIYNSYQKEDYSKLYG